MQKLPSGGWTRRHLKGRPEEATLLRFETKDQLRELVCKVFGITGRFGVRSRPPPRLSENHSVAISENCSINYIQGSEDITRLIWMQTNHDGLDLIFTRNGYQKIVVCYRWYLLHYNNQSRPLNCPCEVVLDMLLHFPKRQPEVLDNENKSCSGEEDESSSVLETTDWQPSNENIENQNPNHQDSISIALVNSNKLDVQGKGTDLLDSVDSVASLLNKGSCFRLADLHSVWKIIDISKLGVTAEVINPGRDLTLEQQETKIFRLSDVNMRQGLKEFNEC